MRTPKALSRTFATSLLLLMGIVAMGGLHAQEGAASRQEAGNLSAQDILERVRLAYASLSTYRDTGWTVHDYQGQSWTNTFSEVLGTRTCYRIELITAAHPFSETNRFWCDGLEHYHQHGGPTVFHGSLDLAGNLTLVAQDTSVPAVYFLLQWGNVFAWFPMRPDSELIRKPDETVGAESCYVVARTTPADPATLWVGAQDFLIRRCQVNGRLETHEHIRTNELFHAADYFPGNVRANQ